MYCKHVLFSQRLSQSIIAVTRTHYVYTILVYKTSIPADEAATRYKTFLEFR